MPSAATASQPLNHKDLIGFKVTKFQRLIFMYTHILLHLRLSTNSARSKLLTARSF